MSTPPERLTSICTHRVDHDHVKEVAAMRTAPVAEPGLMVMELLRHGWSLTLLWDLVDPAGPASAEVYDTERFA
jgi:hypothetical protein